MRRRALVPLLALSILAPLATTADAGSFDGDHVTDVTVWRPSDGTWYVLPSARGPLGGAGVPVGMTPHGPGFSLQWGLPGDRPAPGDYDGDGRLDFVVFRPSEHRFYLRYSSGAPSQTVDLGLNVDDVPAPGDYDGDGKTDLILFSRQWRYGGSFDTGFTVRRSSTLAITTFSFAAGPRSVPVCADYDGDGVTDLAVAHPRWGSCEWVVRNSSSGGHEYFTRPTIDENPLPMRGDVDGDGRADYITFAAEVGTWHVTVGRGGSRGGTTSRIRWGLPGDVPVTADYDGDGRVDFGVFRPRYGVLYVRPTSGRVPPRMTAYPGGAQVSWGLAGDLPIAGW